MEQEGDVALARLLRESEPTALTKELLRQSVLRGDDDDSEFYRSLLPPVPMTREEAESLAEKNGYDLIDLIDADHPGCEIMLVRCQACGWQTAKRPGDVAWGCSCGSHPNSTWALPSSGISGSQCFYQYSSLVGGNGTAWSSGNTGYTYMRIDAIGAPGYLTAS